MIIWPTIKRLQYLERERITTLRQYASALDTIEDLSCRYQATIAENDRLRAKIAGLEGAAEIDRLCADVEGRP